MNIVKPDSHTCLIDGSRLIVESLARSGANTFLGYPITPSNLIYAYAFQRIPMAVPAPDEITALQWMAGLSASGRVPFTATSYPGFALMAESIGMAHMMELPMVIVLAQRLGPSTGSATDSGQGDLLLVRGLLSGGYALPVLCPADFADCWELPALAVRTALSLRTPVVVLTSKEMVMTQRDFDLSSLPEIESAFHNLYSGPGPYQTYAPEANLVPPFLPVGNSTHQVRLNASTHDAKGVPGPASGEALANSVRLQEKVIANLPDFTRFDLDEQTGAQTIIVAWDVTALAAREAVSLLRRQGRRVSLLIPKTLVPLPPVYLDIIGRYPRVIVAEENLTGQLRELLFGSAGRDGLKGVNALGRLITPEEIAEAV
ncbi:MAG: hypothetical protein ABIL25_01115 [candidate division WOR-3 bacterium]